MNSRFCGLVFVFAVCRLKSLKEQALLLDTWLHEITQVVCYVRRFCFWSDQVSAIRFQYEKKNLIADT